MRSPFQNLAIHSSLKSEQVELHSVTRNIISISSISADKRLGIAYIYTDLWRKIQNQSRRTCTWRTESRVEGRCSIWDDLASVCHWTCMWSRVKSRQVLQPVRWFSFCSCSWLFMDDRTSSLCLCSCVVDTLTPHCACIPWHQILLMLYLEFHKFDLQHRFCFDLVVCIKNKLKCQLFFQITWIHFNKTVESKVLVIFIIWDFVSLFLVCYTWEINTSRCFGSWMGSIN